MRQLEGKIELALHSMDFQAAAQRVPPLPLPPVGWISLGFLGCLLFKQKLLYSAHLFTNEMTVFLYYSGTWIQVHTSSKTNKQMGKTPTRLILQCQSR